MVIVRCIVCGNDCDIETARKIADVEDPNGGEFVKLFGATVYECDKCQKLKE